ncbi:MAG: PEGA domain-containing protein [Kofleriaceae bacterium]
MSQQLRALEVDEIPARFKIARGAPRWLWLALAAIVAVVVAATATWAIIRATRDEPIAASLEITSQPSSANVFIDGKNVGTLTPLTYRDTRPGARHAVRVELPGRKIFEQDVQIPTSGGAVRAHAVLDPIRGTLRVTSEPTGAEVYIGGTRRGITPTKVTDLDASTVREVEVRWKDGPAQKAAITWPQDGQAEVAVTQAR